MQQNSLLVAVPLLLLVGASAASEPAIADSLRLNQVQVLASHNSYKQAIDRPLLSLMETFVAEAERLDYHHPSLSDQLNLGLRGLEIDIYNDPQGGHYAQPLGLELLRRAGQTPRPYDPREEMKRPGFKVLHVQDVDFRSNQLTLAGALDELRAWSLANPRHLPVVVTMNLKDESSPAPGAKAAIPWDSAAYDALDNLIRERLGRDLLLTPDDIRGDAPTLERAVTTTGWPKLADCRGKWLWVMDESGDKPAAYLRGHEGLAGRVLFTTSSPGRPESAVLVMNDPVAQQQAIRDSVSRGYLVRTRADAETLEARSNDHSRFEAAMASGAQILSTDYYLADWRLNADYEVRFEGGRAARVNPVFGERAD